VWDTAHCATNDFPHNNADVKTMLALSGMPSDESEQVSQRKSKACLARLDSLAKDEVEIDLGSELVHEAAAAFRSLTGLKTVTITSWSSKDRVFFDR